MKPMKLFLFLAWFSTPTFGLNNFQVHYPTDAAVIKLQAEDYAQQMDQIEFWLQTQDLPLAGTDVDLSVKTCRAHIERIDKLIESYFYAIHLQKLALDCHNLLNQADLAQHHERHLIQLAELVTESGDGSSHDTAFWATDMNSAYEFLGMAGYEVIDGKLNILNDQLYLDVYVKSDDVFGEYKFFVINDFIQRINRNLTAELTEEEQKYFDIMNLILKTELGNNMALINLAYSGVSEAQLLLGELMLSKTALYPSLYADSLQLFKEAANSGSAIGQFKYAYRIFIDNIEERFDEGHLNITEAIEQRYLPAFTLAVIVREKELGIDRDEQTINQLLSLIAEEADSPGYIEYLIGQQFYSDNRWDEDELAEKYFHQSANLGHQDGIVSYADTLNFGLTGFEKNKQALRWYRQAATSGKSAMAYLRIGQLWGTGDGMRTNAQAATDAFVKAGEMGLSEGYLYAGHINYYERYDNINDKQAFHWYQKASAMKNPQGVYQEALMLYQGRGTMKNDRRAFELFNQADQLGFHDAKIFLAAMHETGRGTQRDTRKAQRLYRQIMGQYSLDITNSALHRKMAKLNLELILSHYLQPVLPVDGFIEQLKEKEDEDNRVAIYQLGYLATNGLSDLQYGKGLRRIKKAAKMGLPEAQLNVSNQYRRKDNDKKAEQYLNAAVNQNNLNAIIRQAFRNKSTDPKQYIEALRLGYSRDHMMSSIRLAEAHTEGKLVEKDLQKAIAYYERAIELGGGGVVFDLVDLYVTLDSEVTDVEQAISELKIMANNKNQQAMRNLGEIYASDKYPNKDIDEAIKWYIKAYEEGDTEAGVKLGQMNFYGLDMPQNYDLAMFFFANGTSRKSDYMLAQFHDEPGSFWLALMMQHGTGIEQDKTAAMQLYKLNFSTPRKKEAKNNWAVLTCQSAQADHEQQQEAAGLINKLFESSRTVEFNLGWMYEHGICMDKNHEKALTHYRSAAERKSPHALYRMYQLHQNGQWVAKDPAQAEKFKQQSLAVSKGIRYHNMMSTFMDLPYIKNFQLVEPEV